MSNLNTKLPQELIDRLEEIYTKEEMITIESGFNCEARKPSFRINTLKANIENTLKNLKENWIKFSSLDYLDNCYTLDEWREKDLWDTGAFKAWYIYMQSISSQIPVNIMDLKENNKVLDVTAAPWSKTSQIAAKLNNSWKIIAIDNNAIRIDKLNYTIKKQWVKNVEVFKTDARNISKILKKEKIEKWYFDNILFDAPCSSEWRINLNKEKSYAFWNTTIPKKNYRLQKQILQDVVPLLKSWWELVYSTCTLSPEENEAVVHFLLCNYPELKISEINISLPNIKNGILSFGNARYKKEVELSKRILPSEYSEWFFIAKFIKN